MTQTLEKTQSDNGVLKLERPSNFDIVQIFDCGQCFRFNKVDGQKDTYDGVAFSKYLKISQDEKYIYLYGVQMDEWENVWAKFFDMKTNYGDIIKSFSDDAALKTASEYAKGIRILHQDRWEALCSFIISQNNNIPRIKGIIENMSAKYGEKIQCFDGKVRYAFPTAKALFEAGEAELFALKTGFRAKYIFDGAKKVVSGEINLLELDEMSLDAALETLMKIKGVGPKVAACTLLFGFAKHDAFPIDVWVKKVLAEYYSDGVSRHLQGKNAGIAQQYLFYYERCKNNIFI